MERQPQLTLTPANAAAQLGITLDELAQRAADPSSNVEYHIVDGRIRYTIK